MTDYRIRNHDWLYANRGRRPAWRSIAIFGAIAAVAALGAVSHLTDRFNNGVPGFAVIPPTAPAPAVQFATPGGSRSGT